ncbi:MAG: serine/threonine-protein kinase [Lachnospiraceae bacterium]|nr:serine/threonine-protein kinase [Lachnospiraceae bacterium]
MFTYGSVLEDRYRIVKQIGTGGSSTVYEAVQIRTGRRLAVKAINGVSAGEVSEQEIPLLKNLKHPGLPIILDVLREQNGLLIVMEYMEGENLQTIKEKRSGEGRPFTPDEVLGIGADLCEILQYLHTRERPLIYRDLKPSNIMILPDGRAALVDLGAVCLAQCAEGDSVSAVGTPGFAAPEQFKEEKVLAPETDLFSLGAVLHSLITGRNPADKLFSFEKITEAAPELRRMYKGEQRRKLAALEKIIGECVRFRMEDRCHSAGKLLIELQNPETVLRSGFSGPGQFAAAVVLAVLCLVFWLQSVQSEKLLTVIRQEGKEYALTKAKRSEAEQALEWIVQALELSPGDAECFSVLLDQMLLDGVFSEEEQLTIRNLLDRRAEGEVKDHETLMRMNPEAAFRFAYRIGTACLYASEGIPAFLTAENWLEETIACGAEWKPESEGGRQEKQLLLRRTEKLLSICRYRGQILSGGFRGEEPLNIYTYWTELTDLLDEDLPAGNLLITELGLWKEILGLLTDWPAELQSAGVDWENQKEVTDRIGFLTERLLNSREAQQYPAVKTQLEVLSGIAEHAEEKRLLLEEAEKKGKNMTRNERKDEANGE